MLSARSMIVVIEGVGIRPRLLLTQNPDWSGGMTVSEQLISLLTPVLDGANLELVDIETQSLGTPAATVRILVDHCPDHPLGGRIDLDGVAAATRLVDSILETSDPVDGTYTLEVSSPGLERPLRTPLHFQRFVGTEISVKLRAGVAGERRIQGRLDAADASHEGAIVVAGDSIAYAAIDRARTVFVWGPAPKPTGQAKGGPRKAAPAGSSVDASTSSLSPTTPEVTP